MDTKERLARDLRQEALMPIFKDVQDKKITIMYALEKAYDAHKELWEEVARKHQKALQVIDGMMMKGCPECKARPKSYYAFLAHMNETHGIPADMLNEHIIALDNKDKGGEV